MRVQFLVYTTPAPQGSMKAHVVKGRAYLSCDNRKTMPFRHAVTQVARRTLADLNINEPVAGKHVPVRLLLEFHIARPQSIPKKRVTPAVKPDIDKLCRAALDSLTGVLFADDGQVTEMMARKFYATGPEHVVISMEEV
jgi:Holliday junction resolvase RusA-like endonuclease